MNDTIQQISLDRLFPTSDNRLVGGFDPVKLKQLAESIRAIGVQQPAVVRIHPSAKAGNYEIVAGERRWKAAAIAGLTELPCIVRELDDVTCLRIRLIENLQREDIHPLDEAEGYARLIEKAGYDVELLAKEVGRSASYVYQRLKLRDLMPKGREMLIEGKIQAGHAVLIARLQPTQQKEILSSYFFNRGEEVSVRQVDDYIRRQILLDLSRASFKRDDAELDSKAGPCTTCPKRTGYQPALFADVCNGGKKDYCTDPPCFNGKLEALVQRRRLELKKSGEKHMEVLDRGGYSLSLDYREQQKLKKAGVKDSSAWEECKKGDEDAMPALVVAGDNPGRLTYGRERKENRYGSYEPSAAEKATRKRQLFEAKIKAATRRQIWDAVLYTLDERKVYEKLPLELLRMITQTFWARTWGNLQATYCKAMEWEEPPRRAGEYGHPWERMGRERIVKMSATELFRFLLTVAFVPDLEGPGWQDKTECKRLKEVAAIYQVDISGIEAEVKKEFQEKARAKRAKKAKGQGGKP